MDILGFADDSAVLYLFLMSYAHIYMYVSLYAIPTDGGVHVYTSSKYNGQKQLIPLILTSPWSELESKSKLQGDDEITAAISLNVEEVQQEILGFGGAVTDAAAITYYALPPNERTRLIDAYFGSKGGIIRSSSSPRHLS